MSRPSYSTDQERELQRTWATQRRPECPVCLREMRVSTVPRPREVSYVRRRSWLICPGCGRSVVVNDPPESP